MPEITTKEVVARRVRCSRCGWEFIARQSDYDSDDDMHDACLIALSNHIFDECEFRHGTEEQNIMLTELNEQISGLEKQREELLNSMKGE